MSAIGKTMYAMKCDHPDLCSAELETYDGGSWLYDTPDEARAAAFDYDWVHVEGKDYCPTHAPDRENRDPRERAEYIAASKADAAMADWRPATDREVGSPDPKETP